MAPKRPPDPNELVGLRGLDSVEFNTILLELVQPSKIPDNHDYSRDMRPLAVCNFQAEMKVLKTLHWQPDFDAILERTRKTVTNIELFFPDSDINDFINRQSEAEHVTEFSREHPDQLKELFKLSRQQYTLEHMLTSIQPVQNRDLTELCKEQGITSWPDLKLYTGILAAFVQGLKPHQVNDATAIVTRGFTDYKHTILASDSGTGKTKTYFAAIELTYRRKLKQYLRDREEHGKSDVKFYPTLVLTTSDSIFETWKEGRDHFPNLRLQAYYGTSASEFPDKHARVIKTTELQDQLCSWAAADSDPETGLIVIISTYPTWSVRNIIKLERYEIQQVEGANGCFKEYANKYKALDEIIFEHVIADKAQNAMDASSIYNIILGLLSWKKLLWVTRTLVLSSFKDLISLLSLMWKAYGITVNFDTPFLG
ncbi:hypothetical protein FPOA_06820 [Fusarium poae]|uniref:Uncharacterized protein n=1 Tax=Fusarium poae TaxID=36050 RepID=A0A1B8AJA3_FUSPO|nr:hypothetical protein FPOA_06820 [Fusarium poae]